MAIPAGVNIRAQGTTEVARRPSARIITRAIRDALRNAGMASESDRVEWWLAYAIGLGSR